jgi:ferritin-like metal-binding protein YciE
MTSTRVRPPSTPVSWLPRKAVEHYEISRYGTLRTWAEELGLDEAVTLLQETLDEEEATDEALTEIAKTVVNQEAERV